MLSSIKYGLTFSNGKTIKNELELNAGSTLITGANGKGKSLNFEMVGFALFGNKALRGIAGDYKRMKVEVVIAWYMNMAWINFQKKNEYNPPHNHPCDLSFIAYLQVPKEIGLEHEALKDGAKGSWRPGNVYFDYGEQLPFCVKSFGKYPQKGDLFLFPGWVMHHVHDFKSDVERISVSGNVMFEVFAKKKD